MVRRDRQRVGCLGRLLRALGSLLGLLLLAAVGLVVEADLRRRQAVALLSSQVHGEAEDHWLRSLQQVKLCAVQLRPVRLDVEANYQAVARHMAQARQEGCALAVFPELVLTGLELGEELWPLAEPLQGPTVRRLQALARSQGVALATSVIERADGHYHNTALFIAADGTLDWGRKLQPPFVERARYAPGDGPQVADTPLGRVGMVLCADGFRAETYRNLLRADIQLLLLMAAAPEPDLPLPGLRLVSRQEWIALPGFYSDRLGVPVVSAHATGPMRLILPWDPERSVAAHYMGSTRIVSTRSGASVTSLEDEGLVAATVPLGRAGPIEDVASYGDYLVRRPLLYHIMAAGLEWRGERMYEEGRR